MTDAESIDRYLDATGPTVPAFSADPADRTADRTATVSGHGRRHAGVRTPVELPPGKNGPMTYESPAYEVEREIEDVEIRRYEPYVVAETYVRAPLERAGNGGFRRLAGYIFGDIRTVDGGSTKIAMTTPVTQDLVGDTYRVRFMMPSEYELDSLPNPTDERVTLVRVDGLLLGAISYSGRWSASGFDQHLRRLRSTLDAHGFSTVGEPIWARYDPPWKPWFLRRNEVLLPVEDVEDIDAADGPDDEV